MWCICAVLVLLSENENFPLYFQSFSAGGILISYGRVVFSEEKKTEKYCYRGAMMRN